MPLMVAPIPKVKITTPDVNSHQMSIMKESKQKTDAWEAIKYMIDDWRLPRLTDPAIRHHNLLASHGSTHPRSPACVAPPLLRYRPLSSSCAKIFSATSIVLTQSRNGDDVTSVPVLSDSMNSRFFA